MIKILSGERLQKAGKVTPSFGHDSQLPVDTRTDVHVRAKIILLGVKHQIIQVYGQCEMIEVDLS